MNSQPLYQILGIEEGRLKLSPIQELIRFAEDEILPDRSNLLFGQVRRDLAFKYFLIACFSYLRGEAETSAAAFKRVVQYTKDYFFGSCGKRMLPKRPT